MARTKEQLDQQKVETLYFFIERLDMNETVSGITTRVVFINKNDRYTIVSIPGSEHNLNMLIRLYDESKIIKGSITYVEDYIMLTILNNTFTLIETDDNLFCEISSLMELEEDSLDDRLVDDLK